MVDKFLAWLRSLPAKFLNWWEKFTVRQKTAIISMTAFVIVAFAILIFVVTRPTYVTIFTAQNPTEAQECIDLLTANNIDYKTDEEGLVISVKKAAYTDANLLLGSNNIYSTGYSIDNVTDGGFSTTESDKQKKYVVYLQSYMEDELESYSFVKTATVQLNIPEDDGTLIAKNTEKSASILLELKDACTNEQAAAIARFVATGLGNSSTANVTILDTDGRLLFDGADATSSTGSASSVYTLGEQINNQVAANVKNVLINTNLFSSIEVAPNMVLDSAYTELAEHLYWAPDGRQEGMIADQDLYNSQNNSGIAGQPGTDSNTETTYVYENAQEQSATTTESDTHYLPNESTSLRQIPAGAILYDDSSITVTAITYDVIKEEDVKAQGLLDGITWEEYKIANDVRTKLDVDDDLFSAVANASGVNVSKITIVHYKEPLFIDKEGMSFEATDIITALLLIAILGLLAFVIVRSLKATKVEEEEPEISIEEILKSAPPEELEEIGVEDKSEARKIVEKFVEDNPDAAANLLRNWLSEDWS